MIVCCLRRRLAIANTVGRRRMNILQSLNRFRFIAATVCTISVVAPKSSCLGQQALSATSNANLSLTRFLRKYLGSLSGGIDTTTRFLSAQVGTAMRKEIIVYVYGQGWCGSGGCTMLILVPHDSSYKIIGRATIVRLPIRILNSTTNGRHDISVWVGGGGIRPGYEALLPFDGKKYPSNPATPPARRLRTKVAGHLLITGMDNGTRLYE